MKELKSYFGTVSNVLAIKLAFVSSVAGRLKFYDVNQRCQSYISLHIIV